MKLPRKLGKMCFFTHYHFSAVFIKLRKLLIADCLHTENAEDTEVRKRTVWENMNHRNLNGGPQADEVRIQVSLNDD